MEDTAISPFRGVVVGGSAGLCEAVRDALGGEGVEVAGSLDEAPKLDILVVIAAHSSMPFAGTAVETFATGLGGELRTAFLALKQGVTAIRAKGVGGAVVFVAAPSDGLRSFDALRQGLRLLTKSAALELGPEGIRVNIVLPGSGGTPLGRACTDTDIAAGVAFAVSDRAQFMTGADLVIDGGRMVQ